MKSCPGAVVWGGLFVAHQGKDVRLLRKLCFILIAYHFKICDNYNVPIRRRRKPRAVLHNETDSTKCKV
jgi:hypothetical protein